MKRGRFLAACLIAIGLTGGAAGRSDAAAILVFDENINHRAATAAASLGHSVTTADSLDFNSLLLGGTWDVVVVDAPTSGPAGAGSGNWTPLVDYINGGGKAIMSFWDLQTQAALASAFDVSVASSFTLPQDVYRWDPSHPVFNSVNAVGDLTNWTNQWADDGDMLMLEAMSGATAIAGFTPTATASAGAIVIGNGGRTIYNGFLFDEAVDSVPLIANEIEYVLNGPPPTVPEPSTLALSGIALALGGLRAYRRRRS